MYFMMCLLIGLGISFNITAIWIRHWHHDAAPKFKRKTESPVYLKSISISDMLFLIFQPLMIWQNEKIVWIRFSCYTLTGTISYKNCLQKLLLCYKYTCIPRLWKSFWSPHFRYQIIFSIWTVVEEISSK